MKNNTIIKDKRTVMTTEPVNKLILKLALPTILSMLVTTFYNLADTYFVGKIQTGETGATTSATGAVSVIFSFMAIVQALGFFFGHGSGNYISHQLGSGNKDEAEKMAATGFVSAFAVGLMLMIIGYCATEPLAKLMGSTKEILPYAVQYLRMILIGVPFMTSSLVLNNQLRFQGSASSAMVGIVTGAAINVALDPLFIMVFNMGVTGAGLATVISQIISFVLLLIFVGKGDNIRLVFGKFQFKKFYFVEIFKNGLPSLGRQSISSIANVCLSYAAKMAAYASKVANPSVYATSAIAALGIVSKIMFFGNAVIIGCGQGFQPVCGFNYGAGKYKRVKEAFWYTVKISAIFAVLMVIVSNVLNSQIISVFNVDKDALDFARRGFRYQSFSFIFTVWITVSNMMMQIIGKVVKATLLAISRQGIMFIPAVFILGAVFKMQGVLWAQTVADFLTFVFAVPLQISVLKEIDKLEKLSDSNTSAATAKKQNKIKTDEQIAE